MPVTKDLSGVIDSGMCVSCGACTLVDRSVEIVLDETKQMYQPSHASTEAAASVCPAVKTDFAALQEKIFPGQVATGYGVVDSVKLAQSTNRDRNLKASSGGLIKEMLHHLLAQPDVDGIIALKEVKGLDFRPEMITGADQIDQMPGSIYHNLKLERALQLLDANEGRFVVVAIPCQLEGIYNYIHTMAPHLAERIHTTVGLLCGWTYNWHALRAICDFKKVDFDQLEGVSYRGGGPVGPLRLVTPDGETRVNRRVDYSYQVAFDRSFNIMRCHVCTNHSNFLSDIVVGDAWLPSTLTTKTGISLLICRKPSTTKMIDDLVEAGRLRATDVTTEEIKESQTRRVVFGDFAYAYSEYREEIGEHTAELVGPNRPVAKLAPREEVEKFHREVTHKLGLQAQRRYRRLWWRKGTVELNRYAKRYLRWFFVRVLRIKSLTGQRQEVPREQIAIFE